MLRFRCCVFVRMRERACWRTFSAGGETPNSRCEGQTSRVFRCAEVTMGLQTALQRGPVTALASDHRGLCDTWGACWAAC